MNFAEIGWEKFAAYFTTAAVVVFAFWKTLPPFLTWLEARKKAKQEQLKLDKSETAELKKIEFQHEIELKKILDERFVKLLEAKDKQVAHLENVIDQRDAQIEEVESEIEELHVAERARGKLYMKKLNLLREHRNRLNDIQIDVLNGAPAEQISNKMILALNDITEFEKLLD